MDNVSSLEEHPINGSGFQLRLDAGSPLHFGKTLILGLVSIKSFQLIVNYIQSKPPGQKSAVDTLNLILIRNMQLMVVFATFYRWTMDCTLNSGQVLATILTWPTFNVHDSMVLILLASSVFHQLLILYPHLIEKDFNVWFKVLGVVLVSYAVATDIIMFWHGIYPPNYYEMRRLPEKFEGLIFRRTTLAICLVVTTLLRLNIGLRNIGIGDRQSDSKVIGEKCLLFVIATISGTSFGLLTFGQLYRPIIIQISGAIVLNGWPLVMISSNEKVRSFVKRKYQTEIDWVLETKANLCDSFQRIRARYNIRPSPNVHPLIV